MKNNRKNRKSVQKGNDLKNGVPGPLKVHILQYDCLNVKIFMLVCSVFIMQQVYHVMSKYV